uniref:Protein transport protein Sec31A n=1 Tax=Pseudonaja textilis TaxID=8673 RepID=A0A670ZSX1_PSETE
MKLKEVDRTAMQAWSPSQHHPIYLATGTSAQQLDATFSTNASLEIFELDLTDPALDLKSCATFSSPHSPSGRATVWDLRKNEPIIKVSDHSNRMHCSGLEWHPEVATQMVLASEDDRLPVIQIWDLRFASSPLRVLENHARGILTIAWSMADPELLLSCGKDSKILCSNPNTGEVLYELPTSTQWCFDVQWCPRNPALLSAASFDGKISVYSIMGGSTDSLRQKQADKLSSSFGNLDPFGTGHPLPPLHLPQQTTPQSTVLPLKKPPKWIRRPVGASFSFGGRLVTFENNKTQQQGEHPQQLYHVYVSQVVTEKEFLNRSNQLQEAVQAEAFSSYCQKKIDVAKNDFERNVWSFLKVHFEEDSRGKYLELLGYKKDDIDGLITQALLTGNFESAVDLCLHDNRMADAIILAIAGGQELLSKTQKKYFAKTRGKITRLITAVVTKNWKEIVQSCDLQNWKEALAAVLTYARLDEFAVLCDLLGSRLENEGDSVLQTQACLCFICAGNVEKLVSCWTKAQDGNNPLSLQVRPFYFRFPLGLSQLPKELTINNSPVKKPPSPLPPTLTKSIISFSLQHMQSLPTEKITKKPIPEEHLILKSTFEALIQRCLSSATDPQTKRKLDDANKRLELLYDKLRDQTLSPMIINGLHNIARSIETRNYTEGLNIHTHIVSTSNFSEISAFMPVLKVVLTQANKLGV